MAVRLLPVIALRAGAVARAAAVLLLPTAAVADSGFLAARPLTPGFDAPLSVAPHPSDASAIVVVERSGRLVVVRDDVALAPPMLDIEVLVETFAQGGLYAVAAHPDFATNRRLYVSYTRAGDGAGPLVSVVAEYLMRADDPDRVDEGSGRTIIEVPQPGGAHNGGWIGFAPHDGMLHVAIGEGGNDGPLHAQTIVDDLLGAVLRLDVDGDDFPADATRNYAIPPDNPFVDAPGDDEIWVYGLRNPYRCSFDAATGDLFIADLGAGSREEIDVVAPDDGGSNYGWGCFEGTLCTGDDVCACDDPSLVPPVYEYEHAPGLAAVMGGAVYRGAAIAGLEGTYLHADYWGGFRSFRYENGAVADVRDRTAELNGDRDLGFIVGWGEDGHGEPYVCTPGRVYRIERRLDGDVDGDFTVGPADLALVLSGWGPCAACLEDVDADGVVDMRDVLVVLSAWSAAP